MRPLRLLVVTTAVAMLPFATTAVSSVASAAPSDPPSQALSSEVSADVQGAAADSRPSGIVRVKRSYGQRPVATKVGQRYAFVFDGRKGDRVRVAGGRSQWYPGADQRLLDRQGRRVAVRPDGFATLPRKGRYRLRFVAVTPRAQLVKLQTVLARPGRVTTVKPRRGFQQAVRVRTPPGVVRRVEATGSVGAAMVAGRRVVLENRYDRPTDLFLTQGRPVISSHPDQEWWPTRVRARQQVRLFLDANEGGRIRVRKLPSLTVPIDGGPVALPKPGVGAVVTVPAPVADRLPGRFLDVGLDDEWGVIGVAPRRDVGVSGRLDSGNGLVSPAPRGPSTLVVWPVSASGSNPRMSLSSLALHDAAATPDGPEVRVPVSPDGRRTLVPVPDTAVGTLMRLVVAEAPTGPWLALAGNLTTPPYPHGCNGCGEHDSVWTATTGLAPSAFKGGPDRWILLGAPGDQAEGEFGVGVVTDD